MNLKSEQICNIIDDLAVKYQGITPDQVHFAKVKYALDERPLEVVAAELESMAKDIEQKYLQSHQESLKPTNNKADTIREMKEFLEKTKAQIIAGQQPSMEIERVKPMVRQLKPPSAAEHGDVEVSMLISFVAVLGFSLLTTILLLLA